MDFPDAVAPPAIVAELGGAQSRQGQADGAQRPRPGMRLIFSDEFSAIRLGGGPAAWNTTFFWGGRTLPTNEEEQIFIDQAMKDKAGKQLGLTPFSTTDGVLSITADRAGSALRERLGGFGYTSGLLTTFDRLAFTFGHVEVRARVPKGKGFHPGIWLLRKDSGRLGEIDIMEILGDRTNFHNGTIHYRSSPEQKDFTTVKLVRKPTADLSDGFHVYSLDWSEQEIVILLDGKELGRMPTPDALKSPMYLLIGLAIGGKWAGSPNALTRFPSSFDIDYVRIWQSDPK